MIVIQTVPEDETEKLLGNKNYQPIDSYSGFPGRAILILKLL